MAFAWCHDFEQSLNDQPWDGIGVGPDDDGNGWAESMHGDDLYVRPRRLQFIDGFSNRRCYFDAWSKARRRMGLPAA